MVQETVDERELKGAMSRPNSRNVEGSHQLAVRNIAEQYYAYPTPEFPHLRTFVNEPEVEQRVFTNYGNDLAPDIVVLQWPEKFPVIVAEVVTSDMMTLENAQTVWAVLARLEGVKFNLYVPSGQASAAKDLLKKAKIKGVGLRTWRNNTGLRTIDVAAIR